MKCTLTALFPLFLTASTGTFAAALPTSHIERRMTCSAGLDSPCQDLCNCSDGTVACHADPTSRCIQMCSC